MHGQLYPLRREWHTKLILVNNCFIYTFGIYTGPQSPSPCDYDTSEDAAWSDDYKRIGLTQKDVTWPYAVRSKPQAK